MKGLSKKVRERYEQLVAELRAIGAFRRGSVNVVYRKCGKSRCVCTQEGHPGHGPMMTLTVNEGGKTRTRSLPGVAAVEVVGEQIENHDRFGRWCKRWVELNEQIADQQLEEIVEGKVEQSSRGQKKGRRRSSKRFAGKSRT